MLSLIFVNPDVYDPYVIAFCEAFTKVCTVVLELTPTFTVIVVSVTAETVSSVLYAGSPALGYV